MRLAFRLPLLLLLCLACTQSPAVISAGAQERGGRRPPSRPAPSPPAGGEQLWLTHGEAVNFQGEPAVRFQVYHSHSGAWCAGYFYLTATQVAYQFTDGPRDYSRDSFVHRRQEVQLQINNEMEFRLQIQDGRKYGFKVVRDTSVPWGPALEGVSTQPVQEAWENFHLARRRAEGMGSEGSSAGWAGTYEGVLQSDSPPMSARYEAVLREDGPGSISGCWVLHPPMASAGAMQARVEGDTFTLTATFTQQGQSFTVAEAGRRRGDELTSTYVLTSPTGFRQTGSTRSRKVSPDGLPTEFDLADCPTAPVASLHEFIAARAGASATAAADPFANYRRKPTDPPPTGLYQLETEISFNVLDAVVFDPHTERISLLGHRDPRFLGPPIPYLQHLAVLLENSRPSFTLNWSTESEQRVDRFLQSAWSPEDQQRWAQQWAGELIGGKGPLSPAARSLIAALAPSPARTGKPPGWLGATLEQAGASPRVKSVQPGSPAARAGLRPNDLIAETNGIQALPPDQTLAEIRYLGAGATFEFYVARFENQAWQWFRTTATLGPQPGDPWQGATGAHAVAAIVRAGGFPKAADVYFWITVMSELLNDDEAHSNAYSRMLASLGLLQMWNDYGDRIYNKQITKPEAMRVMMPAIATALDDTLRLSDRPVLRRLQQALPRVSDERYAFVEALDEFNNRALGVAMDTIARRPGGLLIPPEMVASAIGVRPEVVPEFIGVRPDTQLARVLFAADYLGKRLVNMPALAQRFPAYQTQVAFNQTHPAARRAEATYRMWISITRVDVAQSPDGNTLETRGTRMQFNLRELAPSGRNLPPEPGSYGELLTSLYDELVQEFFVLHELREAAKLAAAAEWLKSRRPDLRLPTNGLSSWKGPSRLPGLVFIYLHEPTAGSRASVTVIASGGVALEPFPPGPAKDLIPVDSSVVDLRDLGQPPASSVPGEVHPAGNPTVPLFAYDNQTLRKVLRREIVVPDYHPPGWFARATTGQTKGKLFTEAVSVLARAEGDAEERLQVARKLEEARRLAHVLENVDHTLNLLTAKNLGATEEFERLTRRLSRANDHFIESAIGILTQGLDEAYGYLKAERAGLLPEAAEAEAALQDAESKLKELKGKLDAFKSLRTAAAGFGTEASLEQREQAIRELGGLAKDMLLDADPNALGPLGKILGPVAKAHNLAGKLENVYSLGQSLVDLESSAWRLRTLDPQSGEYQMQIKHIQKVTRENLISRIGGISNDPLVKKYLP